MMLRRPSSSLRTKLTLLYVGLLALLLLALGSVLYRDTSHFLHTTTVAQLRAQAKPVIDRWLAASAEETIAGLDVAAASDLSRDLTSRETTAVVYDEAGEKLADGRRLPEESLPAAVAPAAIARALAGENEVTYVTEVAGQRTLVALIPLRPAAGNEQVVGVVQLSSPLALVDAVLWRQRALMGLGTLVTLGVGIAGGLWLTTSTLGPLRQMIATCRRIAAGDLGQRVNLPNRTDEVGELAVAFDDMAARIESTFAAQRRFIADAAHELRTPLTALGGSVEVLLRGARDDPASANRLLQGMHRDLERLRRMTEQLLDLSALDAAPTMAPVPIALEPFLAGIVEQARLLGRDRVIQFESGTPVTLRADVDGLERALVNLVDNAVQHTAPGGVIQLGWRSAGDSIEMWVADDGEGIGPGDLPHVFEPFYRGDRSRSRRQGGTGLGLALVRSVVEAHDGNVSVESQGGEGARFVLRLPIAAAPLAAIEPAALATARETVPERFDRHTPSKKPAAREA